MRRYFLCLTAFCFLTASGFGQGSSEQTAPGSSPSVSKKQPLTNSDIVKMVKAGLPESTINAVIEQSEAAFDTNPPALIELKNLGVPPGIIESMVRAAPVASAPVSATTAPIDASDATILAEGTYYKSPTGWVKLQPQMMGGGGATHVAKAMVPGMTPHMVFTFRGAESPVQISEHRPIFYFKQNPAIVNFPGRSERDIVLVRFDKKKDHRELQMTSGATMFTFKAGFSKEKTPEILVKRVSETVFTVTPSQDLSPGEYLLTFGLGASGFDFGITAPK